MIDQPTQRSGPPRLVALFGVLVVLVVVAGLVAAVVAFGASSEPIPRHYGVNVIVADNCFQGPASWKGSARNAVTGVKSLGADTVAFAFPFYTKSVDANGVYVENECPADRPHPRTSPTPTRLAVMVRAAHAVGLRVVLRPLLDEANLTKWRGAITPKDPQAWFESYSKMLDPYLRMAKATHVEQFGISGELNSLVASKYWPDLIKRAHHLYPGKLTLTATWPVGAHGRVKGTSFGVDAYPRLRNMEANASVAQLLTGWNKALHDHKLPAGVTLYEVGIKAVEGAYKRPSDFAFPHARFNEQIQANWFEAACRFVKSHRLGGLYVWGPDIRFNHGKLMTEPLPKKGSQLQPATQAAIRACFTGH